jgi:membrane protein DedA with SNARE-associated domain
MLADFVDTLATWVQQIVTGLGAPGITLVALFENLFPPTPSEFLYPLAGKMAFDGAVTLPLVILAGVIGSLMGSAVYYTLGYQLGADRAREAIARYGTLHLWRFHITLFTVEAYDKALALFEKHGGKIVFFARIMPLVHGVVSIPAGVTRMKPLPFVIYTALGSAAWIAPLATLGYWLGSQWEQVLAIMDAYETLCYGLFAAFIVYLVVRRVQKQRREKNFHHRDAERTEVSQSNIYP